MSCEYEFFSCLAQAKTFLLWVILSQILGEGLVLETTHDVKNFKIS